MTAAPPDAYIAKLMNGREREDRAIETWCAVVSRVEGGNVVVVERPDRDRPGRGGCDAIIERGGVRHAVEHMTIDAYLDRRQDDARFRRVMVPLEQVVSREFPDSWIEIVIPANAISTGVDWSALAERLAGRVCDAIRSMPLADYYNLSYTRFQWADIPFPALISRQVLGDGEPKCLVFRATPEDRRDQLIAGIARALAAKAEQLRPYANEMPTVLLLEFDDTVLLNDRAVADAFAQAIRESDAANLIDEIYLVDARRRRGLWVMPVKLGAQLYPRVAEYRQYQSEQFRMMYGER